MNVLVIGGSGCLSGPIARQILNHKHKVFVCNRGTRADRIPKGCELIKADRKDLANMHKEFGELKLDAVIDSIAYLPQDIEDDLQLFPNVKHFIFISTVDVYGTVLSPIPAKETNKPNPQSGYAKNKHAVEERLIKEFDMRLFPITIFRCSHILGPGGYVTSLWGRSQYIVDRIMKGKPVPIVDGGRNLLTPVYSEDAAWGVANALFKPITFGQVYNLVGPAFVTLKEYISSIGSALNKTVELVSIPATVHGKVYMDQAHLFYHRCYSFKKLNATIGYNPPNGIFESVKHTVQWMNETNQIMDCSEDPFDDELTTFTSNYERELEKLLRSKNYTIGVKDGWSSRKIES